MSIQSIVSKDIEALHEDVMSLYIKLGKTYTLYSRFKLGREYDRVYFLLINALDNLMMRSEADFEDDVAEIKEQINILILNCKK